jgi:hypothetical protein
MTIRFTDLTARRSSGRDRPPFPANAVEGVTAGSTIGAAPASIGVIWRVPLPCPARAVAAPGPYICIYM